MQIYKEMPKSTQNYISMPLKNVQKIQKNTNKNKTIQKLSCCELKGGALEKMKNVMQINKNTILYRSLAKCNIKV